MREPEESAFYSVVGKDGIERVVHGIKSRVVQKHKNAKEITPDRAAEIAAALRAKHLNS